MVKNLSAVQETWVLSLSQEDPLEKGMATHFSILAWEIPWTEEPSGVQSMESQRVGHDWVTNMFTLSVLANFFFFFFLFFFFFDTFPASVYQLVLKQMLRILSCYYIIAPIPAPLSVSAFAL